MKVMKNIQGARAKLWNIFEKTLKICKVIQCQLHSIIVIDHGFNVDDACTYIYNGHKLWHSWNGTKNIHQFFSPIEYLWFTIFTLFSWWGSKQIKDTKTNATYNIVYSCCLYSIQSHFSLSNRYVVIIRQLIANGWALWMQKCCTFGKWFRVCACLDCCEMLLMYKWKVYKSVKNRKYTAKRRYQSLRRMALLTNQNHIFLKNDHHPIGIFTHIWFYSRDNTIIS